MPLLKSLKSSKEIVRIFVFSRFSSFVVSPFVAVVLVGIEVLVLLLVVAGIGIGVGVRIGG